MKKILYVLVAFVSIIATSNVANAQTTGQFGHTMICGIGQIFNPAVKTTTDGRLPTWWDYYDKTPCAVVRSQPSTAPEATRLKGYCSPFPNKTSPVSNTAPFCQGGNGEKVNGYVCNTGSISSHSCGATAPADYEVTNLSSGSKLSLGDLKNRFASNYTCGQTVQLDVFNQTCTNDMIKKHYDNLIKNNVGSGDQNGDGVEDIMEARYFVNDANGTPTFCLAKDSFVWYTGDCEKKNPACVLNGSTSDMYVGDSRTFSSTSSDADGGSMWFTGIYSSPTTAESWTTIATSNSNSTGGTFTCPAVGSYHIVCNARDDENVFCSGNPFTHPFNDCGPNDHKIVRCLNNPSVKAITIDKTLEEAKDIYEAQDYVKFKIVVKNTGNTPLENTTLEDIIPILTSFDELKTREANGGTNPWTCTNGVCNANLGTLTANASKTLYFVVKVLNYTATGDIRSNNKACVTVLGLPKECDEVPFDLKDLPHPVKSIRISKILDQPKTTGTSPYQENDKIAFLIEVKNTGNEELTNVVLTDTIPVLTTFLPEETRALNTEIGFTREWGCQAGNCTLNLGSLAIGQSIKTYFVAKVSHYEIYDESIVSQNRVCVSTTGVATSCTTATFNLLKLTRPGGSSIDITKELFITDDSPSQPFEENDSIIFKIKVKNDGETDLTSVQLEDIVPTHTVFDSETTNSLNAGWNCDGASCFKSLGVLAPTQEDTIFYAVKVLPVEQNSGTDLKSENAVCVEAIGTNPVDVSDCDKVTFDIKDSEEDVEEEEQEEGEDVSISKKVRLEGQDRWEDKISDVSKDDIIEFKIKVENKSGNNTSSIDDLKMEDKLPDELEKLNGSLTVYWDDFDQDEDKTFIIKAKVRPSEFDGNTDECVDNKAIVLIDGDEEDEAEATVCYSNVELAELPDTGAGTNITIFSLGVLLLGIYYRRQVHKQKALSNNK
jgi:uncharacterized repeat protein (TIGR01451 family)